MDKERLKSQKLKFYCRPGCKVCDIVEKRLINNEIEYEKLNVDENIEDVSDSPFMMLPIVKTENGEYIDVKDI
jgi:hypothetical protein